MMNYILQCQLLSPDSSSWNCHLHSGRCEHLSGFSHGRLTLRPPVGSTSGHLAVASCSRWVPERRTPGCGRGDVDGGPRWVRPASSHNPGSSVIIHLELFPIVGWQLDCLLADCSWLSLWWTVFSYEKNLHLYRKNLLILPGNFFLVFWKFFFFDFSVFWRFFFDFLWFVFALSWYFT